MTSVSNSSANPHGITSITYSPQTVYQGSKVTISVTFGDSSNITSVDSFYCKLTPEYLCHTPYMILTKDGNTYTTSFTVEETSDATIGFDVIIKYNDDSKVTLPGDEQLDFGMAIAEPYTGIFYYEIDISSASSIDNTENEKTSMTTSLIPFALLIPVYLRRK